MWRNIIITFFITGAVYAGLIAMFDWNDGKPFSITRFVLNFIILGVIMSIINYFNYRRNKKGADKIDA